MSIAREMYYRNLQSECRIVSIVDRSREGHMGR
jgi:hypothetical protein